MEQLPSQRLISRDLTFDTYSLSYDTFWLFYKFYKRKEKSFILSYFVKLSIALWYMAAVLCESSNKMRDETNLWGNLRGNCR